MGPDEIWRSRLAPRITASSWLPGWVVSPARTDVRRVICPGVKCPWRSLRTQASSVEGAVTGRGSQLREDVAPGVGLVGAIQSTNHLDDAFAGRVRCIAGTRGDGCLLPGRVSQQPGQSADTL